LIKQTVKEKIGMLCQRLRLTDIVLNRSNIYNGVLVLSFHKVVTEDYFRSQMTISRTIFSELLDYLVEKTDVIKLSALPNLDLSTESKKLKIALTFDDGYKDNYDNAYPELLKRKIPASIFVASGYMGGDRYLWWDLISYIADNYSKLSEKNREIIKKLFLQYGGDVDIENSNITSNNVVNNLRIKSIAEINYVEQTISSIVTSEGLNKSRIMLNWSEIKEMSNNGIDIGGHSVNHVYLNSCTKEELISEIRDCKNSIESFTDKKVENFAYPDGRYNNDVCNALKDEGYKISVSTESNIFRRCSNLFSVPRVDITSNHLSNLNDHFSTSMWHYQLITRSLQFNKVI
jgi:peptidoglycan/xylan/chitin deacetylase (PgdA/CDA1 family)